MADSTGSSAKSATIINNYYEEVSGEPVDSETPTLDEVVRAGGETTEGIIVEDVKTGKTRYTSDAIISSGTYNINAAKVAIAGVLEAVQGQGVKIFEQYGGQTIAGVSVVDANNILRYLLFSSDFTIRNNQLSIDFPAGTTDTRVTGLRYNTNERAYEVLQNGQADLLGGGIDLAGTAFGLIKSGGDLNIINGIATLKDEANPIRAIDDIDYSESNRRIIFDYTNGDEGFITLPTASVGRYGLVKLGSTLQDAGGFTNVKIESSLFKGNDGAIGVYEGSANRKGIFQHGETLEVRNGKLEVKSGQTKSRIGVNLNGSVTLNSNNAATIGFRDVSIDNAKVYHVFATMNIRIDWTVGSGVTVFPNFLWSANSLTWEDDIVTVSGQNNNQFNRTITIQAVVSGASSVRIGATALRRTASPYTVSFDSNSRVEIIEL